MFPRTAFLFEKDKDYNSACSLFALQKMCIFLSSKHYYQMYQGAYFHPQVVIYYQIKTKAKLRVN